MKGVDMFQCKHCGKENATRWNAYGEARCKFCKEPWSYKDEQERHNEEFNMLASPDKPLNRKSALIPMSSKK